MIGLRWHSVDRLRVACIGFSLAAIFGFAAWQRFSIPRVPIPDPDTWGYLCPALTWLSGEGMVQTAARGMAYPVFMLLALCSGRSFDSIVTMQQLAGLAAGMAWWWVWVESARMLPGGWIRRWMVPAVGLAGLFGFLCDGQRVVDELRLRPEAVFPLVVLLGIGRGVCFIRERWIRRNATWAAMWAGIWMMFTLACYSMKPSWELAVLVAPAVVGLGCLGVGIPLATRFLPVMAVILGTVLAWFVPPAVFQWQRERGANAFLPMLLFGVHADIIHRDMMRRVAAGTLGAEEALFAEHLGMRIEESRRLTEYYRRLGFNPDYLMFHSDTLERIPGGEVAGGRREFYLRTYVRSLFAQPFDYVRKWLTQLSMAYSREPKMVFRESVAYAPAYRSAVGTLPVTVECLPDRLRGAYEDLLSGRGQPAEPERLTPVPRGSGILGRIGAALLLPLSVGILASGLVCSWRVIPGTGGPDWRWYCWTMAMVVIAAFLSNLTVAVVHSFDIERYLHLVAPLNWLVLCGGTVIVAAVVTGFFARRTGELPV